MWDRLVVVEGREVGLERGGKLEEGDGGTRERTGAHGGQRLRQAEADGEMGAIEDQRGPREGG